MPVGRGKENGERGNMSIWQKSILLAPHPQSLKQRFSHGWPQSTSATKRALLMAEWPTGYSRASGVLGVSLGVSSLMLILLAMLSVATLAVSQEGRYRQEIKLSIIPVVGLDGKHSNEWGVAPSVPFFVTRRYAQRGDKVSVLINGKLPSRILTHAHTKICPS